MNNESPDAGLPAAPRFVAILLGLFILPLTILIGLGGYAFFASPSPEHPYLALLLGTACIVAVIWLLSVSWRLISNRPRRTGGLFSPLGLRVVGSVLIAAPFLAALSGTLFVARPVRWWPIVQAVIYLLAGVRLLQLASVRSKLVRTDGQSPLQSGT